MSTGAAAFPAGRGRMTAGAQLALPALPDVPSWWPAIGVQRLRDAIVTMSSTEALGSGSLGSGSLGSGQSVPADLPAGRGRGRLRPVPPLEPSNGSDHDAAPDHEPPDDPSPGVAVDGAVDPEHREIWELVELARGGDGEAFGQIYDRYADIVYRYIFYRVSDRGLAEDLTSETFLRALRRIATITYQGKDIGAWFVTIARNLILDHVKSARSRLETTTDDIGLVGDLADSTPRPDTPEALVLDSWRSTRLMEAVDELNAEQRECVLLRFVQGFSVSETAAVMGKNDGAIKALQHRAVRKLAVIVGDEL